MDRIIGSPATTWRPRQSRLLVRSRAGACSRSSAYADRQFLPWTVPVDMDWRSVAGRRSSAVQSDWAAELHGAHQRARAISRLAGRAAVVLLGRRPPPVAPPPPGW